MQRDNSSLPRKRWSCARSKKSLGLSRLSIFEKSESNLKRQTKNVDKKTRSSRSTVTVSWNYVPDVWRYSRSAAYRDFYQYHSSSTYTTISVTPSAYFTCS